MDQPVGERPLRVAVVGLGRISGLHLDAYRSLGPGVVHVAAVADADADRARAVALALGCDTEALSTEAIMRRDDIDAVEILVPSPAQAEIAFAALDARKHVTLQKPMAADLATASALCAAAHAAGVRLRVFENTVNHPAWRCAEDLIARDAIGEPLSMHLRWANSLRSCGWPVPPESWAWRHRGAWAERFAAPALFDDSAHLVSPAISLFGPISHVVALSGQQRLSGRRTGFPYALAWHHRHGGQAMVEGTLCTDLQVITEEYSADTSITITGSAGILWINTGEGRVAPRPTVEVAAGRELRAVEVEPAWRAAWPTAQREWVDALRHGTAYRWTGQQALEVLEASLMIDAAVRRSAEST